MQPRPHLAAALVLTGTLLSCNQAASPQSSSAPPADTYSLEALNETGTLLTAQSFTRDRPAEGAARVRVSFSATDSGLPNIGVRSVFLCGQGCVSLGDSKTVRVAADDAGNGTLYADALMPGMRVDRIIVQPDPNAGAVVPFKVIKLAQPIELTPNHRHEVFLDVERETRGKAQHLKVSYLASGMMPPSTAQVSAYRPGRALRVRSTAGVKLDLPAVQSEKAQLLGLEYLNTGGVTSRFTVWPRQKLNSPATVTLDVNLNQLAQNLTLADYFIRVNGQIVGRASGDKAVTVSTSEMGDIDLFTKRPLIQALGQRPIALPEVAGQNAGAGLQAQAADTSTCRYYLQQQKQAVEDLFLQGANAVRMYSCETTAPFVHIVVINRRDRTQTIHLPYDKRSDGFYNLHPITFWGAGASVATNATLWEGDKGFSEGDRGFPLWPLKSYGEWLKVESAANRAMLGFQRQPLDGSGGTSAEFFEGISSRIDFNTHNYNIVGSTTSIVKNGGCSQPATSPMDRWSAVGIGLNRMVLVSSTSDSQTNAYELCTVFQGLGFMNGAIQLDGGTATSMYWGGAHLNPLSWEYRPLFGTARSLMNALVWK